MGAVFPKLGISRLTGSGTRRKVILKRALKAHASPACLRSLLEADCQISRWILTGGPGARSRGSRSPGKEPQEREDGVGNVHLAVIVGIQSVLAVHLERVALAGEDAIEGVDGVGDVDISITVGVSTHEGARWRDGSELEPVFHAAKDH